ncbi:MAG TPA: hypothetical protein VJG13_04900, partial [Thermoanaerobaculia bacterium]|nr:hypothetical protein [Thermoanaerobaculia bacterium]
MGPFLGVAVVVDVVAEEEEEVRAPAGDGRELYRRVWADTRFAGTLTVDGLLPATAYEYRLRAGDEPLAVPTETLFTTAAPEGAPEDLRIAFGSCAGDWGEDPSQPIFR